MRGDLALGDATQPHRGRPRHVGRREGRRHAVVTQSGWGIKPYSILFGTLKVVNEIDVRLEAALQPASVESGMDAAASPRRRSDAGV